MAIRKGWVGYAWAAAATVVCTLAGLALRPRLDLVNVAMIYLLAVGLVALRWSRGPAVVASILAVVAFDVVFVPPQGALTVDDLQYLLTFAIMVGIGVIISGLRASVRREEQARGALALEAETERIRSTLLASISHDLRTPLAVMTGASSTLVERGERMSPEERRSLARSIFDQAREMSEHVA